jgi:RimJ/RimL family protein N-acetyltransferase
MTGGSAPTWTEAVATSTVQIEEVSGEGELTEFCLFADRINAAHSVYWPAIPDLQLPLLLGRGPVAVGRRTKALVARSGGDVVARVAAVVDERYLERWDEPLGHLVMFEALPDTTEAVRALLDSACDWLRAQGLLAVRTGSGPAFDMPYLLDAYDVLPPMSVRQNPAYYHTLIKEARFGAEKGWVDYKIEVTPERIGLWEQMVAGAQKSGFRIATLSEVDEELRVGDFTLVWEEAFARHWGASPQSEAEWRELFDSIGPIGGWDVSVLAYDGDEPVGAVLGIPDLSMMAVRRQGRELRPDERLNLLGIGVREVARGRGVNLAIAARSYLAHAERGNTHVSYTMVLDDNWPSRRTAEKLGARVCANYLVYRRELGRPAGPAGA